jgi:sterol desaturase/sphingolipid hydroxylase (fatty acid hydroxylase superfamily)
LQDERNKVQLDYSSMESLWTTAHLRFEPFMLLWVAYGTVILNYVLMGIIFAIVEKSRLLDRWKIQPRRHTTASMYWKAIKNFVTTYLIVIVPTVAFGWPVFNLLGIRWDAQPFPSLWTIVWQNLAYLVLEDFFEYWGHRALHIKKIYWIHKIHHDFMTPFAFSGAYAHPIEIIWLGLATFLPTFVLPCHLFTFYIWINVRQFDTAITHCGYELPGNMFSLLGSLYGGTAFHDYHHTSFNYNFASRFTFWDKILGTYKHPEDSLAKKGN